MYILLIHNTPPGLFSGWWGARSSRVYKHCIFLPLFLSPRSLAMASTTLRVLPPSHRRHRFWSRRYRGQAGLWCLRSETWICFPVWVPVIPSVLNEGMTGPSKTTTPSPSQSHRTSESSWSARIKELGTIQGFGFAYREKPHPQLNPSGICRMKILADSTRC